MAIINSKITIDKDKVGSDLTGFPVFINLADMPAYFWPNVKEDGGDIRIYQSDLTTECPLEIVSIDTTGKTGLMYFKGDLSSTSDTDFYISYGDESRELYARDDTYGSDNVWTDFDLVTHLAGELKDSSANNMTIVKKDNATLTEDRFGNADKAYVLDTEDVKYKIEVSDSPHLGESGDHTYSFWVKINTYMTGSDYILCHYNWRFAISSKYLPLLLVGRMTNASGPTYTVTSPDPIELDEWVRYKGIYHPDPVGGNGYLKLYVNGELKKTESIGDKIIYADYGNKNLQWGNTNHGVGVPVPESCGPTDVYAGIQSDDWILTEYNNQSSPATFYTIDNGYYSLAYTAGSNGSLTGETMQRVAEADDGSTITAVPDSGYVFDEWDDYSGDNIRTDRHIDHNIDVTASFVTDQNVIRRSTYSSSKRGGYKKNKRRYGTKRA